MLTVLPLNTQKYLVVTFNFCIKKNYFQTNKKTVKSTSNRNLNQIKHICLWHDKGILQILYTQAKKNLMQNLRYE